MCVCACVRVCVRVCVCVRTRVRVSECVRVYVSVWSWLLFFGYNVLCVLSSKDITSPRKIAGRFT